MSALFTCLHQLATDGFAEHERNDERFADTALEGSLRRLKDRSPSEICAGLLDEAAAFSTPDDDMSVIVIKRIK
jgi:serine phosphatase RsbU (regulator of sigma subunit)